MSANRRSSLLAVIAMFLAPPVAYSDDPLDPDFNPNVVAFARSKVGEKVGNGVCSTFIQEALKEAGAKVLRSPAADGEYLWGEPVKSVKEAKPGDIVQFEKVVFKGRRRIIGDNGQPAMLNTRLSFPHHSAIVSAVGAKGKTVTILHQNAAGPDGQPLKIVQESTLVMAELQKGGSFKIYRPVAP
ncbi:MAG: hypothetical protein JWN86_1965 [Planctomycetota bacterium]|nr:hypothetical protein [Planctomycetota bacterium]